MDTIDSIRMRFRCLPLWANGETRRHEGICPNSYIDGKWICLGNYVMPELAVKDNDSLFSIQGAYAGTGTVAGSTAGAAPSSPASAMVFSGLDKISESSSKSNPPRYCAFHSIRLQNIVHKESAGHYYNESGAGCQCHIWDICRNIFDI